MEYIIYFADKAVCFTSSAPQGEWSLVRLSPQEFISRSKVAIFLENNNFVAVLTPDPQRIFDAFVAEFTLVEAAGGLVVNDEGEWLLMRRNGRWDLPKGHREEGEALDVCAVREVEEETGVAAQVVRPLCETLHAYYMHSRWELKRTHWYEMHVASCDDLHPQTEEGIVEVVWCSPHEAEIRLACAFATIRSVGEAMQ